MRHTITINPKYIKGNFKDLCDRLDTVDLIIKERNTVKIGCEHYDLGDFPGISRSYDINFCLENNIANDFLLAYKKAVKERIKEIVNDVTE